RHRADGHRAGRLPRRHRRVAGTLAAPGRRRRNARQPHRLPRLPDHLTTAAAARGWPPALVRRAGHFGPPGPRRTTEVLGLLGFAIRGELGSPEVPATPVASGSWPPAAAVCAPK